MQGCKRFQKSMGNVTLKMISPNNKTIKSIAKYMKWFCFLIKRNEAKMLSSMTVEGGGTG